MSEQNGTTALATRAPMAPTVLDDAAIETLRKTIAKELAPDEFALFVQVSKRLGLSPLAKQIYALKVGGRMVLHVGIDGYRVLAERSRVYGGQFGPYWADAEGEWHEVWLSNEPPAAAKVGILRKDWKAPLWGVARFKSYNRDSPNWRQQPDVMLAKAAEALAIRKAFPQELAGAPEYRPEYDEPNRDDEIEAAADAWERMQPPSGVPDPLSAYAAAAPIAERQASGRRPRPAPRSGPVREMTGDPVVDFFRGDDPPPDDAVDAESRELGEEEQPADDQADDQADEVEPAPPSKLWPKVVEMQTKLEVAGLPYTLPPADQDDSFIADWLTRQQRALDAERRAQSAARAGR